ncbi:UNVERIFIED_CONTAM: hypothetical protein Slati_2879100 [Sesamum latifolium]|uniref:Uncharacterized protein n=1 Tax=Sesamum latifolium TaxID=2727402 RepID=A0AAW2VCX3_9LAMI
MAAYDDRLNKLTSLVEKIIIDKHHVKACGICTSSEHATNMCPTLQEPPTEHADAIGGFFGQQQRRYDPFFNTYNSGWKDHQNLSYGTQPQNFQRPQYKLPMPFPSSNPKQAQKRKPEKEIEIPQEQDDKSKEDHPNVLVTRPPFPKRFTKSKKEEEEKEIFETFRKVEVNIPLLDGIK